MDYSKKSLEMHKKNKGKLEIKSKVPVEDKDDLSTAYTPGVAAPCMEIANKPDEVYNLTIKANTVGVITDGSAVLGLGNIGAEASIPVMEGKAILFKRFADIDAIPLPVATQDTEEIIRTSKLISPVLGGINLEDISAPRCFEIEERLKKELDIPVFHDDQHGTAIVVLAGLMNALRLAQKALCMVKIVIVGAGAAGIAITKLLLSAGAKHIVVMDTKGAIYRGREDGMNKYKKEIAKLTNPENEKGHLKDIIKGKDIFIGVSKGGLLKESDVKNMNNDPIIFAMANPEPEIRPDIAKAAGAFIVATGRSDYPNQVNNVLAFPGIFRGALDTRACEINEEMKYAAAMALSECIGTCGPENIIPSAFTKDIAKKVARSVAKAAISTGCARVLQE